jgi:acyl-CoA thioester hydrolase
MEHLNTRHYVAMFDDASQVLLTKLAYSASSANQTAHGWADVRNEVDYFLEVRVGSVVELRTGIVRVGRRSLTVLSEMFSVSTGQLHARFRATLVYFDLEKRQAAVLTEDLRDRAATLAIDDRPALRS